jgi:hypothetical protein
MKSIRQMMAVRSTRRGSLTMELLLVLPILMFLLLGMFEFSLLFLAQGEIETAAHSGARLATLHGVHELDVIAEVERKLSPRLQRDLQVDVWLAEHSGEEVVVTVQVPSANAAPDLLWPIGYSLRGKVLTGQSRMNKE